MSCERVKPTSIYIYNSSKKEKNTATFPLKFLCLCIAVRNVKPHVSVLFVVSTINVSNLACDNYLSLKIETVSIIETWPIEPTSSSAISSKQIRRYNSICCVIIMKYVKCSEMPCGTEPIWEALQVVRLRGVHYVTVR